MLVVTAVTAERDAITRALPPRSGIEVIAGGVGPAASAAATTAALVASAHDVVLSAGIGGGFAPLVPGSIAVASACVFADLGAQTADGFGSASALGFGDEHYPVDADLAELLRRATGGTLGPVLTVATVTGTAGRAAELMSRHPGAVAEAMEGAGVAAAAAITGRRFGEIRAISNPVGPRDRERWDVPGALAALGIAIAAVAATGAAQSMS